MMTNTPSAKEKVKALDLALQQIEKQFGKGAIMKLGEESANIAIETISTGSIGLDMALGVGGVPRGRIVEIYGPESSGKTTLALTIIANAQRQGGNAVMIDAEREVEADRAGGDHVDRDRRHLFTQLHDGALAELLLDLLKSEVESLVLFLGGRRIHVHELRLLRRGCFLRGAVA